MNKADVNDHVCIVQYWQGETRRGRQVWREATLPCLPDQVCTVFKNLDGDFTFGDGPAHGKWQKYDEDWLKEYCANAGKTHLFVIGWPGHTPK